MKSYKLRNRVEFEINTEGRDTNKLINTLHEEKIRFFGLSSKGDILRGYVRYGDFTDFSIICDKLGFKPKIRSRKGYVFALNRYKKRWGIPLGIILAAMLVGFLSDRVMIIEIDGCDTAGEERIISLLEDCGIYYGSSISEVNLYRAQQQLLAMDDTLSWASIRNNGSRVIVSVREITNQPEMERKNTPCNIVASRDAQIKSVKVYNGMLSVMIGDVVKKGDVIVSGVVNTKYGKSYYVHSIAEITGIYTEKMTFSQSFSSTESEYTSTVTKKAFSLFGKRFRLGGKYVPEGDYEYRESSSVITLGKIRLPFEIIEMNYDLFEEKEITLTEEQALSMIDERISRYENNLLTDNGAVIVGKDIAKTLTEKGVTLTVTYTVEGEIGVEKQVMVKGE